MKSGARHFLHLNTSGSSSVAVHAAASVFVVEIGAVTAGEIGDTRADVVAEGVIDTAGVFDEA